MKYLSFIILMLSGLLLQAQNEKLIEINSLLTEFASEQDLSSLNKAEKMVKKLFATSKSPQDLDALMTKGAVYHAILEHSQPEDPMEYASDLKNTYRIALEADADMQHRQDILMKVYLTKNLLITKGNEAYVDKNYEQAHSYFSNALDLNTIEIDFPRYMTLDTTILYSKALFAKLSDQRTESIENFERLVDMEYDRSDIYDYLIRLYGKEGDDKNIQRITELKEKRYPEE